MFFETRQEMKQEGIVEVCQNQMGRGKGSTKSVGHAEVGAGCEAVELTVSLGFLNSGRIVIPSFGMSAEASAGQSENS
jgi:hypothetical protein